MAQSRSAWRWVAPPAGVRPTGTVGRPDLAEGLARAEPRTGRPRFGGGLQSRWTAVFAAAWLLSAAICVRLAVVPGYPGDMQHYKYWTRLVTLGGVQAAYSGTYPETYAIYPPVTLYAYQAVGNLYQTLVDPAFEVGRMLASHWLGVGIKGVAIGFHLLLGLTLFALLRVLHGTRAGALAATGYLLNPAAIFDVAYWGQPDAAHSLWAVLAAGLLELGLWGPSWVALGVAAMTKPQAWALLPLFAWGQWLGGGARRVATGLALMGGTAAVLALPFILTGHLGDLTGLPREMAATMPVASAFAHNVWWVVTGGAEPLVYDQGALIGPVTYRHAALVLLGGVTLFALWQLARPTPRPLAFLAAYQAFGWFCLTTRAHENHAFFVLPLLAMALPSVAAARPLFAGITLTVLLNMLLHDPSLAPALAAVLSPDERWSLQMANAGLNLLMLALWTGELLRATRQPSNNPSPRRGDQSSASGLTRGGTELA